MAFWGIEVKPGKPYTHSNARGRLRITQATLAIGSSTNKSVVQCNVGDKSPVILCVLLPNKTESLQLDLEFEESEDVIFSVIGPRGVCLAGYYVGNNRLSNMQDDTESYGEDIANSETKESDHYSDEDEYEDSFINDDEPEPLSPSPISSSRDDDEEGDQKKRNGKGVRRRLKKNQYIESDDEMSAHESDDEDKFQISSMCKKNMSEEAERISDKETTFQIDEKTKASDDTCKNSQAEDFAVLDSKNKVDEPLVDDETEGKRDQHNMAVPPVVDDLVPKGKTKPKKKRQEPSKDGKAQQDEANINKINQKSVLKVATGEGSDPVNEVKTKKKRKGHTNKGGDIQADAENDTNTLENRSLQTNGKADSKDHDVIATEDDTKTKDLGIECPLEALPSAEVGFEKNSKEKKNKRKKRNEVNIEGMNKDQLAGDKQENDQLTIDDKDAVIDSNQLDNGNLPEEKKIKKKRRKTSKTQETEEKMEVKKENESSAMEIKNENDSNSSDKNTLSNGLIIEDLVKGNSRRKAAVSGKKVKVQYEVKLKETGEVIDSNIGKSPHKFRLGDKEVMEGLNAGVDGMRVGDKRRLVIPPSMSNGYQGFGENIPPNSWLVYEVELLGLH